MKAKDLLKPVDPLGEALHFLRMSGSRQQASQGLGQPSMPPHPGPAPIYLPRGPFPKAHHVVLKHHLKQQRERTGVGSAAGPAAARVAGLPTGRGRAAGVRG